LPRDIRGEISEIRSIQAQLKAAPFAFMGRLTGKNRAAKNSRKLAHAKSKTAPWYIRTTTPHDTPGHPDVKRRGEAAEAAFIARATSLNFTVAKPWGESGPFDVLVGSGKSRAFWRVQVKCAYTTRTGNEYEIKGGGRYLYTAADIDFLAAHIVPENAWYIVPIDAFEGSPFLYFYPRNPKSRGRYEKYREAWCLLTCPEKARGWNDIPILCRCRQLPVKCAACPNR
jgi:hypothetical protein